MLPTRKFGTKGMHNIKIILTILFIALSFGLIFKTEQTIIYIKDYSLIAGIIFGYTAYILKPQKL